jgi:predicted alpha/beta superfamily hydrolase
MTGQSDSLFHHPDIFQRYLIGSPAIFWDNGVLWEYEQQFAEKHHSLNINAFISVGAQEDAEPYHFSEQQQKVLSHVRLVDDTYKMVETLKQHTPKGLEVHSHVFEGETHMSVVAPWLSRGLRTLFKTHRQPDR